MSTATATDNGTTTTASTDIDRSLALAGEHWCIAIERGIGAKLGASDRVRAIADVRRIVQAEGIEPEVALRRLRTIARLTLDPRDGKFWRDKARGGYGGLLYVFKQAKPENMGRLDAFTPTAEWEQDSSPAAFERRRAREARAAEVRAAEERREKDRKHAESEARFAEARARYGNACGRIGAQLADEGVDFVEVVARLTDDNALREMMPELKTEHLGELGVFVRSLVRTAWREQGERNPEAFAGAAEVRKW
jgi:hypothetical protein